MKFLERIGIVFAEIQFQDTMFKLRDVNVAVQLVHSRPVRLPEIQIGTICQFVRNPFAIG